jgi:Phosphate-selective porin O and P
VRWAAVVVSGLLLTGAGGAHAQEEAPPAADTPLAPEAPAASETPDRFRWTRFELRGRVLVRGWTDREDGQSRSDFDAENARLELRWRPATWLRGVVEYDQAEDKHLKDAYFAFRGGRFEVRAGQFKPPVSPLQMESRWDLPSADRGLLSEVLIDSFGIAGRRPGLQVEWDQAGGPFVARAGLFRASSVRGDRIGDGAFDNLARDWQAVKTTGRLAWRHRRVETGVSFDLRPAEPVPGEGYSHFWTAGADFTWSRRRDGPRAWAEAYAGSSWQDSNAFDGESATFLSGRVLAGWRFGGRKKRDLAIEPYAAGTLFDPDTSIREDLLWEVAFGIHLGALGHLRLDLEAQHRSVARNAPLSLGLFPLGEAPPSSRTRLVAQLGAAF